MVCTSACPTRTALVAAGRTGVLLQHCRKAKAALVMSTFSVYRPAEDPTLPYIEMVAPFALAGAGMALVFAPAANAVLGSVRPEEAGQASGATNAIREVGGVLGVAVLASVFSGSGGYASPAAFVDGLIPAVAVAAIVLAVGAAIALAIPGLRRGAPRSAEIAVPA